MLERALRPRVERTAGRVQAGVEGGDADDPAAVAHDPAGVLLVDHALRRVLPGQVAEDHRRAVTGKPLHDRPAYPPRPAGRQSPFTFQCSHSASGTVRWVLPVLEQGRYRQMVTGTDRHGHGPASGVSGSDARWLSAALVLILAFMAGEIVAGLTAHSLALISDAAHMLTDAASIALVLVTARLAARPPAGGYTYGLRRTEIMSAQANGITLVLLAAWLGYSAIRRLVTPPPTSGGRGFRGAPAGGARDLHGAPPVGRGGGPGHRADRVHQGRRDRHARRGGADAARGRRAGQGVRPDLPRGRTRGTGSGGGRRRGGAPPPRHRGP